MLMVGCDYHPRWQQVAWLDVETGETGEQKLVNGDGEAERWYQGVPVPSLVGLEATGNSQWFIDLLQRLGHEVWIGDAAAIRASYVRRQKNDRRDAGHVLKLLQEGRFPRLWVPDVEQRDVRQLLIHRHKLVQIRARVKNGLQHLAMNQGMQKKAQLWSVEGQRALRALPLAGWARCRRQDLLELLAYLDQQIVPLDMAAKQTAAQHPQARLLYYDLRGFCYSTTCGAASGGRGSECGSWASTAVDSGRAHHWVIYVLEKLASTRTPLPRVQAVVLIDQDIAARTHSASL